MMMMIVPADLQVLEHVAVAASFYYDLANIATAMLELQMKEGWHLLETKISLCSAKSHSAF